MKIIVNSSIPQTSTTSNTIYTHVVLSTASYNVAQSMDEIINLFNEKLDKCKISTNSYTKDAINTVNQLIATLFSFSMKNHKDIYKTFIYANNAINQNTSHHKLWSYLANDEFVNFSNHLNLFSYDAHQLAETQIFLSKNLLSYYKKSLFIEGKDLSNNCLAIFNLPCYTQYLKESEKYIISELHEQEINLLNIYLENHVFYNDLKRSFKDYVVKHAEDLPYHLLTSNKEIFELSRPLVLYSLEEKLEKDPQIFNKLTINLSKYLGVEVIKLYQKLFDSKELIEPSILEISTLIELKNKHFNVVDLILKNNPTLIYEQSIARSLLELHLKHENYATNLLNQKKVNIEVSKIDFNKMNNKKEGVDNNSELLSEYHLLFAQNLPAFFILSNNSQYYQLLKLEQFKNFSFKSCEAILSLIEKDKIALNKTLFEKIQIEQNVTAQTYKKDKIKI